MKICGVCIFQSVLSYRSILKALLYLGTTLLLFFIIHKISMLRGDKKIDNKP